MIHPDQEVYRFCPACAGPLEPRRVEGADRPVCTGCGRIHFLDPKVAAGCIVRDEADRILLVRRAIAPVDTWTYPGGYVDRLAQPDEPFLDKKVVKRRQDRHGRGRRERAMQ